MAQSEDARADIVTLAPEEIQLHSAELHERIGRNYLDARKFAEAVAAFQKAQALYPPGAGRLKWCACEPTAPPKPFPGTPTALTPIFALTPSTVQ